MAGQPLFKDGDPDSSADGTRARQVLEGVVGVPFSEGNTIRRLRNGVEIFPPMLEAIRRAEHSIEFLTFVYWTGRIAAEFAEALAEKARQGVTVRVLLDGVGARPMSQDLLKRMTRAGCQVRWFRPLPQWRLWAMDNRTHRKVLVVDGRIGFTGGVGIAEEWEGDAQGPNQWRETHFEIHGPAVHGLRGAFWGNWMEVEQTVKGALTEAAVFHRPGTVPLQVVRSTASIGWSDVAMLIDALIASARHRLRITTAYFAPDDMTVRQLQDASLRGVDVQIILPGPHIDTRVSELAAGEQFEPLLTTGVRIWRYQPTMIHTKVMLADDRIACIGSANFNQRSMRQDDEICLVAEDADLVRQLDADFDADRAACEPMTLRAWRRRGVLRRLREAGARVVRRET